MDKLFEMFAKAFAGAALILLIVTLLSLITAFPVKWAWNCSVPGIWGLKEIGFWEAFCLIWLAGSFGKGNPNVKS